MAPGSRSAAGERIPATRKMARRKALPPVCSGLPARELLASTEGRGHLRLGGVSAVERHTQLPSWRSQRVRRKSRRHLVHLLGVDGKPVRDQVGVLTEVSLRRKCDHLVQNSMPTTMCHLERKQQGVHHAGPCLAVEPRHDAPGDQVVEQQDRDDGRRSRDVVTLGVVGSLPTWCMAA
jgi:hypothetical protein